MAELNKRPYAPQDGMSAGSRDKVNIKVSYDKSKREELILQAKNGNVSLFAGVDNDEIACVKVGDILFRVLNSPGKDDTPGLAALNGIAGDVVTLLNANPGLSVDERNEMFREAIKQRIQPIGISDSAYMPNSLSSLKLSAQVLGERTFFTGSGKYGDDTPRSLVIHPGQRVKAYVPHPDVLMGMQAYASPTGALRRVTLEAGPAEDQGNIARRLRVLALNRQQQLMNNPGVPPLVTSTEGKQIDLVWTAFVKLLRSLGFLGVNQDLNVQQYQALASGNVNYPNAYASFGMFAAAMENMIRIEERFVLGIATKAANPKKTPKVTALLNVGRS